MQTFWKLVLARWTQAQVIEIGKLNTMVPHFQLDSYETKWCFILHSNVWQTLQNQSVVPGYGSYYVTPISWEAIIMPKGYPVYWSEFTMFDGTNSKLLCCDKLERVCDRYLR